MTQQLGPIARVAEPWLARAQRENTCERIWKGDPTVWAGSADTAELSDRLGWLTLPESMASQVPTLVEFADEVRNDFARVVLLGMGGSSLAPEVCWRTFGRRDGYPRFDMLDSTDPRAVLAIDEGGATAETLFIVSSKSGTTVETRSFYQYFWERSGQNGNQFVAITDPGSALARLGEERRFRHVFLNPPEVGGRFSALSLFGLVPAALIGIDVRHLLGVGGAAAAECRQSSVGTNPAFALGTVMGSAAIEGRDKLTLILSPSLESFGLWAEQLVAESTGKEGKGILPVVERPGAIRRVVEDRLFVTMSLANERETVENEAEALEAAGHPVVRIVLDDAYDIAAEFFRWEFATTVSGWVLEVNPFDQPNVAESKKSTKRFLESAQSIHAPGRLRRRETSAFMRGVEGGDYVAIQAFLPPGDEAEASVARVREAMGDRLSAAITAGYGPRYLHSTGQLHKGGPPRGHFLQLFDPPKHDISIPGESYTFGQLLAAQAEGDRDALTRRGRPVLQVVDIGELLELL